MKSVIVDRQAETQSAAEWFPRHLNAHTITWNVEFTPVSQGGLRAHLGAWRLRVKNSDFARLCVSVRFFPEAK